MGVAKTGSAHDYILLVFIMPVSFHQLNELCSLLGFACVEDP
jgi:hypothetical protein